MRCQISVFRVVAKVRECQKCIYFDVKATSLGHPMGYPPEIKHTQYGYPQKQHARTICRYVVHDFYFSILRLRAEKRQPEKHMPYQSSPKPRGLFLGVCFNEAIWVLNLWWKLPGLPNYFPCKGSDQTPRRSQAITKQQNSRPDITKQHH